MLMKRIISTFLLILMLLSATALTVSAAEEAAENTVVYEYNTEKGTPTLDYMTGLYTYENENGAAGSFTVSTQAQKLETMDLRLEQDGFRMYVDAYSGEVAVECIETGDVMFTNPYDATSRNLEEGDRYNALSQIIIDYIDTSSSTEGTLTSFEHAVMAGDAKNPGVSQVNVKTIQNGLRVEYSIGRVSTRYLVPERIEKSTFETKIKAKVDEACEKIQETIDELKKQDEGLDEPQNTDAIKVLQEEKRLAQQILGWFKLRDVDAYVERFKRDETIYNRKKEEYLKRHPEAKNGPIYEFNTSIKKEYAKAEQMIKKYCPDFTFEELDAAHLELSYTAKDQNEPLFRVALEYTIDEKGLSVRLPANGVRFDESIYRLENIQILPYMGAAAVPNTGYSFFPDGSGALFDFETMESSGETVTFYGDIYGADYAYHTLNSENPHNEVIRYPVYGLKEDITNEAGEEQTRGFLAIIEEGESMTKLNFTHTRGNYNTFSLWVNPRPKDSYELSKTGDSGGTWTVVSPRKYTGDFRIRYVMLADPDVKTGDGYYEPSYVGMAKAYRDYLEENEVLQRLTEEDVRGNLPLYIETFGAIETTEKFLSIPYNKMKALTSFENIRDMYLELAELGIGNINFVLTGYEKGGLTEDRIPYNLNWDGSVEKEMKFEELVEYATDRGFGLYPDFDFAFASTDKMFDGLTLSKHAVRTVDGRYISKREYSATRQTFVNYFELAMSPAYFSHFYEKFSEDYSEYNNKGIAITSLGQYLTSDFDEDEPYHREDSKGFTEEAFEYFDDRYENILISGGNAYTWKYVDYITDIATDSSRHVNAYATVPFLGIVLHGYVQTAGEAINMEGNVDYALLRAIENGSALKFILSYQNTENLRLYPETSEYYSVRYDIWKTELLERYRDINLALNNVQLSTIEHHEFIKGQRIPTADEIVADYEEELRGLIQAEIDANIADRENIRITAQNVRKYLVALSSEDSKVSISGKNDALNEEYGSVKTLNEEKMKMAVEAVYAEEENLRVAYEAMVANNDAATVSAYEKAKKAYDGAISTLEQSYTDYKAAEDLYNQYKVFADQYKAARDNFAILEEYDYFGEKELLEGYLNTLRYDYNVLQASLNNIKAEIDAVIGQVKVDYAEELGLVKVEEEKETFDKYAAADNSIVYEVYENKKAFILNFNNYAVVVELGGRNFTVDAYDYVIVEQGRRG